MSISVLLITHDNIGQVILDATKETLGECPLQTELLEAARTCDPDEVFEQAKAIIKKLDRGEGVLILTDLFGATPSNICSRLLELQNVRAVSGLNLSMLIRVQNYPEKDLNELTEKALDAGRSGVLEITDRF